MSGPKTRRVRTRLLTAAAAGTALVLTSGCGVSAETLRPGVAAEVDGDTITMSQVDDATQAYCALLTSQQGTPQAAPPVSGSSARIGMLQGFLFRTIAGDINDDYGFKPGSYYNAQLKTAGDQLGVLDTDQVDHLLPAYTGFSYFVDLVSQFGVKAEGLAPTADQQAAFDAGLPLVVAWLKDHPVDTDPSFPSFEGIDPATGVIAQRHDLASAVSSLAVMADDDAQATPTGDPTAYVDSLPASQRCGG